MLDQDIRALILEHALFTGHDDVLVGVSGGPDSMCLLLLLWQMREEFDISLQAAHVNHGLRGRAADADEALVRQWCRSRKIPCFIKHVDARRIAARSKRSLEDACRHARLTFFQICCRRLRRPKLALAHTRDDQAETVLLRLVRGTGITGLCAMRLLGSYNGLPVARPLLRTTKDQILHFVKAAHQPYRYDTSNEDVVYARNRVRRDVMPLLQQLNPRARDHLARLADHAQQAEDVLEHLGRRTFQRLSHGDGPRRLMFKRAALRRLSVDICRRVLRMALSRVGQGAHDISAKQSDSVQDFLARTARSPRVIMLPRGTRIRSQGKNVVVEAGAPARAQLIQGTLEIGRVCSLPAWGYSFSLQPARPPRRWAASAGRVEYLDRDALHLPLRIRTRRPGDLFWPLGAGGKKKLSDFFIDQKIPETQRDLIPLVVSGRTIIWVVGHRVSDRVKIKGNTRRVVRIAVRQFREGAGRNS